MISINVQVCRTDLRDATARLTHLYWPQHNTQPPHQPGNATQQRGGHMKESMTTEQILQGLKHYRRIARQDMLRATETPHPEAFLKHAESRREIYAALSTYAETNAPSDVIEHALKLYQELPFVTGTAEHEHTDIKGHENALENFFLLVGLDPKTRREARSKRHKLETATT